MNSFPIVSATTGSLIDFVNGWSNLYDYNKLFEEENYENHIYRNTLTSEDVIKVFVWKNGMRLSKQKNQSLKTKILPKLDLINRYKKNHPDFETIKGTFKNVSAIWLIFLAHIIDPKAFPIFDQHVYRAFVYLRDKKIEKINPNDKTKLKVYQNEYLPFFNERLVHVESHKKLDEAMWSFGRFLSLYPNLFI